MLEYVEMGGRSDPKGVSQGKEMYARQTEANTCSLIQEGIKALIWYSNFSVSHDSQPHLSLKGPSTLLENKNCLFLPIHGGINIKLLFTECFFLTCKCLPLAV